MPPFTFHRAAISGSRYYPSYRVYVGVAQGHSPHPQPIQAFLAFLVQPMLPVLTYQVCGSCLCTCMPCASVPTPTHSCFPRRTGFVLHTFFSSLFSRHEAPSVSVADAFRQRLHPPAGGRWPTPERRRPPHFFDVRYTPSFLRPPHVIPGCPFRPPPCQGPNWFFSVGPVPASHRQHSLPVSYGLCPPSFANIA